MGKSATKEVAEKSKLQEIKAKMETKYGKGVIISGSDRQAITSVPTGSYKLDKATTCGGIPRGKLVEMFGQESCGKSTIALEIIAKFQKQGLVCVLADYEYSFDAQYAYTIGVDVEKLIIVQPDTAEDGFNIIYEYITSGEVALVVIDSHTAMVPKDRLEGTIGDAKMAPEARLNSQALKKIKPQLEPNNCTLLGISQLRANIGGMGDINIPTGGAAWKFYSDMRFKIFKVLDRKNEKNDTTIEVIKNKCGRPYGKCIVPIAWGIGVDEHQEILDIGLEVGIIKLAGSWYSTADGNKLGQGSAAVKDLFASNPDYFEELKKQILEEYNKTSLVIAIPESEGGGIEVVENVPV